MKQRYAFLGWLAGLALLGLGSTAHANDGQVLADEVAIHTSSQVPHVPLSAISPETLRTFVGSFDLVRRKYANPVDDETLFRHAISGMLKQLDSHAEFLDETALKNLQSFTEGGVADVGLTLRFDETAGHWVVESVAKEIDGLADDVAVGDYVHQIGDKKLDSRMSADDVAQLMLGITGTQLELVVSKEGRGKHSITLQRLSQKSKQVSITVYGDIAVIKLPVFTDRTRQHIIEGLVRIHEPIKGIVLDVRSNPGGVLSSAVQVASLFMDSQPVLQIVERGEVVDTLSTLPSAPFASMPVMVLQNRYSASASEVLALALKADKESFVAGETSYGKGSIQSIFPIGEREAIKLTTAYYRSIDGVKIDGVGVKPDVAIDFNDENWLSKISEEMDKRKLDVGVLVSLPSDY